MSTRLNSRPGNAGKTRTKYFSFAEPPNEMVLDSGERLGPITLAYETYGRLDDKCSNAILLLHALSGDAHAAGISEEESGPSAVETALGSRMASEGEIDWKKLGWWDNMVGPGKAFDTDRYFVICSNIISGCRGSTGPSSVNPATGRPFGLQFPVVTVADMVRAQKHLIEHLEITSLLAVAGGSMGGHQALAWAVTHPEMVRACIPIASSARLSAQGIAFNEVGRQAIMADPNWRGGGYYGKEPPAGGLAVARMIGHVTYLSEESMHQKFGRQLRQKERFGYNFATDFEVESYLRHQGEVFVQRFDANSYLYITKAIDYFDLANGYGSLVQAFNRTNARFLVISFSSDWLYPSHQSQEIVRALKICNRDVSYVDIKTSYGHDAFLLEEAVQTDMICSFLARTYAGV